MTTAERSARYRSNGKAISVVLDHDTFALLKTLEKQLDMTRAEAITAALRALSPQKAKREATEAEVDAIFAAIEAQAARARQLRSNS